MRPIEIILFATLALHLIIATYGHRKFSLYLSVLILVVLAAQLGLEGYRWQLIPIYALALSVAVGENILRKTGRLPTKPAKHKKIPATLLGLFFYAFTTLPAILLPVPGTPQPSGPYKVGSTSILLVDDSREEIYAGIPGQPRRLMVQIWYPAQPSPEATTGPWVERAEIIAPHIARYLGLPAFFLDHIQYAGSHAYPNAPIVQNTPAFPMILFSHGWNGFRAQNSYQVEELVSHGYIVIAPDHTYGTVATVFPDGSVALNNPAALPTGMGLPEDQFIQAAQRLGEQWAGDLSFILDTLQQSSQDRALARLSDRMDFSRIGALGHSTGGGAAIQYCAQDIRCSVVFGMDPYFEPLSPEVFESGLDKPLLAIFSQVWHNDRDENSTSFNQLVANASQEVFHLWIQDTAHFDFTDLPGFSPLAASLGLKGSINGPRVLQIINAYTVAYFDSYLKGEKSSLLMGPAIDYSEVMWE